MQVVSDADRWFAVGVRSLCQFLLGLLVSLACRRAPWGPRGKQVHLLALVRKEFSLCTRHRIVDLISCGFTPEQAVFSACSVLGLDLASRQVPAHLLVTCQVGLPVVALVFSLALCL